MMKKIDGEKKDEFERCTKWNDPVMVIYNRNNVFQF